MNTYQLTTVQEAVTRIRDGSVISFNGIGLIGMANAFFPALEKRFLESGHPRDLTLYSACGLGSEKVEMRHLTHPGMFSCLMAGYMYPFAVFAPALTAEQMEGYNIPQGVISRNYREAAAGRPGFFTKVGLHTFADPRHQGCALNRVSTRKVVELRELDGEEYLYFHTVKPDVCVLRGTTADPSGNITFEKECNVFDPLAQAMAVHNNGGLVMIQVERLSAVPANPHSVGIPGNLVDVIWVEESQPQTNLPGYNPYYSGELRAPQQMLDRMCEENLSRERIPGKPLTIAERVVARRAALELQGCYTVNLGIGTPMLAASEAMQMGIMTDRHHLSIETGVTGGVPVPDAFGAVINADAIYEMAAQFDLYEGGGLDATLVGALEIDGYGNVNVIKKGDMLIGAGGFHHVTYGPRKVVICSRFRAGSGFAVKDGKTVLLDGHGDKFVKEVECIALNAAYFRSLGKEMIYITERGVFTLDDNGLVLSEIAPGLHPLYHIQNLLPFEIRIAPRLKYMPSVCFAGLGLTPGTEGKG